MIEHQHRRVARPKPARFTSNERTFPGYLNRVLASSGLRRNRQGTSVLLAPSRGFVFTISAPRHQRGFEVVDTKAPSGLHITLPALILPCHPLLLESGPHRVIAHVPTGLLVVIKVPPAARIEAASAAEIVFIRPIAECLPRQALQLWELLQQRSWEGELLLNRHAIDAGLEATGALRHILIVHPLAFDGFLVEERLDAHPTGFAPEMTAQGICSRKSASAAPLRARTELATADEFLLAAVETLMAFTIVLPGKGLLAHRAHKWPFIGVGTKMRAKIVGSCELLRTQMA